MGASSSCCFCFAKAEESSCTANDGVGESEMVGAEGASTSGRTEYYSARCETMMRGTSGRTEYYSKRNEAMMRSRDQFCDDVALEIEFSKSHWSEVSRLEVAPQSAEEKELTRENKKLMKQLKKDHLDLFSHTLGRSFILGRMIAKGGQAEIYEVEGSARCLMKVFERGTSLRDLQQSWPLPVLNGDVHHCILRGDMLEDGRFAFMMIRRWGNLRKLIDQAMQEKNVDGIQGPLFPYNVREEFNGWNFHDADFMLGIAREMRDLHEKGVSHRDLKASNILVRDFGGILYPIYPRGIVLADFECSIGVLGTEFWRAPEILLTLGSPETITNEQWKKADVYSYGMICFEIVTGQIPFDGELGNTKADRQRVIEGKRPQLPSDLDDSMKDLITKCWAPNPRLRPTFSEIVDMVETISTRQCQFRLFGIGDELPPQYRLATVQEVNEYPFASVDAMRGCDIANLANGSVHGSFSGLKTRLVKQSDTSHKLARFHH